MFEKLQHRLIYIAQYYMLLKNNHKSMRTACCIGAGVSHQELKLAATNQTTAAIAVYATATSIFAAVAAASPIS